MPKEETIFDGNVITDCAHLIDLAPDHQSFNQKEKGNEINHSKAKIEVLSIYFPKNGIANLL